MLALPMMARLPILILVLLTPGRVLALSDPLDLPRALQGLEGHPRVKASPELRARIPRRPSLYLDCRRLAFSNTELTGADARPSMEILLTPLAAQRLEVAERFFDVLLADLSFATESEAMAVAYVQYDRARARQELGQFSELRVMELESRYQDLLHRRVSSELSQQLTRSLLAQALDHTGELPRHLIEPGLPTLPDELPGSDTWLSQAMTGKAIAPLESALGANERALVELELRQQISALLLRLRALDAARRSVLAESALRDLKLDQSRTLYEQEVTADLGYSMSRQTRTRMLEQRIGYCRTLAWAELRELIGQPLWIAEPDIAEPE